MAIALVGEEVWSDAFEPLPCWAPNDRPMLVVAPHPDDETLRRYCGPLNRCWLANTHLGAVSAGVWGMGAVLDAAGREIDAGAGDGMVLALTVRHLVEQACTDALRGLPRAYGLFPLAMDAEFLRRYEELDLYLRQSHTERDLEALGRAVAAVE